MKAAQAGWCSTSLVALVVAFCAGACGSKKDSNAGDDTDPNVEQVASQADRAIDAAPAGDPGELHVGVGPCGLGSKVATPAGDDPSAGAGPKAAPKGQASGTVTVTSSKIEGDFDKELVERYLRLYTPRLRFCYQRALAVGQPLAGVVNVVFDVDEAGKVTGPTMTGTDRDNLFACFAAAFESRAFPKPENGVVRVHARVVLTAGDEGDPQQLPPKSKRPAPVDAPVGSYDYERVSAAFAPSTGALRSCLEPPRVSDPALRGTFGIGFTVPASGAPTSIAVDTALDAEVHECIAGVIGKIVFPTHELKLAQNVMCYFEYGAVPPDEARNGAPVIEITAAGVTIDGAAVTSVSDALAKSVGAKPVGSFAVVRAGPDVSYGDVHAVIAQLQAAGVRYIAMDAKAAAGWEAVYTPPAPQARYHGRPLVRDPLHIHISTDAIRVRGAKKIRAKNSKHDFDAVADAMGTLVSKPTYAHRSDVAVQADADVPYSAVTRVIQDAVRHGLTQIDLQAPTR